MNTKQFLMTALVVGATTSYGLAQETADQVGIDSATANVGRSATEGMETNVSSDTQKFMQDAATGGMMEVALGKMAQEKASSQEVKAFGERMVTDHTKANDELKSIAQEKSVVLPDAMSAKQQRGIEKLSGLSGAEFDQEYMKMMVKDHEKDVKDYQKASENVSDQEVQDFAAKTLPTLKEHLQKAENVNDQLRSS